LLLEPPYVGEVTAIILPSSSLLPPISDLYPWELARKIKIKKGGNAGTTEEGAPNKKKKKWEFQIAAALSPEVMGNKERGRER
jgi:hypothetical protein